MTASRLTVEALPKPERCSQLMGSVVVSTAPVGVPPTGRQRSPQLTSAPNGEWNLLHHLFGETPNRATGTVALPVSNGIVPAEGEVTVSGNGAAYHPAYRMNCRTGRVLRQSRTYPSMTMSGAGFLSAR